MAQPHSRRVGIAMQNVDQRYESVKSSSFFFFFSKRLWTVAKHLGPSNQFIFLFLSHHNDTSFFPAESAAN